MLGLGTKDRKAEEWEQGRTQKLAWMGNGFHWTSKSFLPTMKADFLRACKDAFLQPRVKTFPKNMFLSCQSFTQTTREDGRKLIFMCYYKVLFTDQFGLISNHWDHESLSSMQINQSFNIQHYNIDILLQIASDCVNKADTQRSDS